MPRHIKFGLVALALIMGWGMAYFYNLQGRISEMIQTPREAPQPYLATRPVFEESAPKRQVKVFFPSLEREGLLEFELREIRSSDQPALEAKQIIAELIEGPREEHGPAVPQETQIREAYLLEGGLMVVDLTSDVSSRHPGGLTQEVSSVYALVNSLTVNLPAVTRIRLLIEGRTAETLAGHIDLTQAFHQELSLTSLARANTTDGPVN